jgi:hypothetical protein
MRKKIAFLAFFALAMGAAPSNADSEYEGPWCARFGGGTDFYERCSMRSFQMCLDEIRGTGGNAICSPNPWYRAPAPRDRRKDPAE